MKSAIFALTGFSEVRLCSVLGRLGDAKEHVTGILSMRVLVSETQTQ
jgi:hypothetical protein